MFINENACGGVWCGVIMVEVARLDGGVGCQIP
jgi:hypothetical protein